MSAHFFVAKIGVLFKYVLGLSYHIREDTDVLISEEL